MWRTVIIGTSLALAACGTAPHPGPSAAGPAQTVQNVPAGLPGDLPGGVAGPASDAPFFPFGGGRLPPLRRWAPDDTRPSWLRDLPEQIERHRVPDNWPNDTLGKVLQPPA
ncbi:MAG TPA: hypothetical protein VGN83_05395 [Falsiroseomonas sp.]|jgi:hypothetical protein|nr:hypothetical protein [Falsiroseomonas sp.]